MGASLPGLGGKGFETLSGGSGCRCWRLAGLIRAFPPPRYGARHGQLCVISWLHRFLDTPGGLEFLF